MLKSYGEKSSKPTNLQGLFAQFEAGKLKRGEKASAGPAKETKGPEQYPKPILPQVPKAEVKTEALFSRCTNARGTRVFRPAPGIRIPRNIQEEMGLKKVGDDVMYTWTDPTGFNPIEGITFGGLYAADNVKRNPTLMKSAYDVLKESVASNGVFDGMVARMEVAAKASSHKGPQGKWLPAALAILKKRIPMSRVEGSVIPKDYSPSNTEVVIDLKTQYGMPYVGKTSPQPQKEERKADLIYYAAEILNKAESMDTLIEDMRERPYLYTFLLKRKMAVHTKDELKTKVRPYYVTPGHLVYLFSTLMQPTMKGIQNTFENPDSWVGFKFTWFHGGAAKMAEWLRGKENFKGQSYGDDIIFRVKLGKKLFVLCPDMSHMDMSLGSWVSEILEALREHFQPDLPGPLVNIWQIWARLAFTSQVMVGGAASAYKLQGLASGIPGTPLIDEIVSILAIAEMQAILDADPPKTEADLKVASEKWVTQVREKYGLVVKPSTVTEWVEFPTVDPKKDTTYKIEFLGYKMGFKDGQWIPVPRSFEKLIASAVLPTKHIGDYKEAKVGIIMSRLYGLTVCGGFQEPCIYEALRGRFKMLQEAGHKMSDISGVDISGLEDLPTPEMDDDGKTIFPTVEEIYSMYTEKKVKKVVEKKRETVSSDDEKDDFFSILMRKPKNREEKADQDDAKSALKDLASAAVKAADTTPIRADKMEASRKPVEAKHVGKIPPDQTKRALRAEKLKKIDEEFQARRRKIESYSEMVKGHRRKTEEHEADEDYSEDEEDIRALEQAEQALREIKKHTKLRDKISKSLDDSATADEYEKALEYLAQADEEIRELEDRFDRAFSGKGW